MMAHKKHTEMDFCSTKCIAAIDNFISFLINRDNWVREDRSLNSVSFASDIESE